jgi:hypothetical protein
MPRRTGFLIVAVAFGKGPAARRPQAMKGLLFARPLHVVVRRQLAVTRRVIFNGGALALVS